MTTEPQFSELVIEGVRILSLLSVYLWESKHKLRLLMVMNGMWLTSRWNAVGISSSCLTGINQSSMVLVRYKLAGYSR